MSANKINVSVRGDELLKASQKNVERAQISWRRNWSWMIPEYIQLQKDLADISATRAKGVSTEKEVDDRILKPFPVTTTGMIGWVAKNNDFRLEVYGKDVFRIPLPRENRLRH